MLFLEQLARYEKNNRRMFLVGCFFVLLVVAFWIVAALNAEDFSRLILNPEPQERQMLNRIRAVFPAPTPRENMLLAYCETLIIISVAVMKIFTIRFVATLTLIIGMLTIGFTLYVKKVLKVVRGALETK